MANMKELNEMLNRLMTNSAELESENNKLKEENDKISKELIMKKEKAKKYDEIINEYNKIKENLKLLTNDIEKKAIEIQNLKNNNLNKSELEKNLENKTKELNDYKNNSEPPEKLEEIENELNKYKIEKKNLNDKIKNYEKQIRDKSEELAVEKNTNKNKDQRFYEYKLEYEKKKEIMKNKITELEKIENENNTLLDNIEKEINILNEKNINSEKVISSINSEKNLKEKEVELAKKESLEKVKKLQEQISKSKESIIPLSNIKELLSENTNLLYINDTSLTYQNLFNYILVNFSILSKSIFINIDGGFNNTNSLNIYQDCLRDIYFLLFITCIENKNEKEKEKKLNPNDFTEDIILNVSNIIYKYNIFKTNINNYQTLIDDYTKKFNDYSLEDDFKKEIQDVLKKKFENSQLVILNNIKNVVKKCRDSIKENNIEIDGKIIYHFDSNFNEVISINKSCLNVNVKYLNSFIIEILINKFKFPNEPINKIKFNGDFNKVNENFIQRIVFSILSFFPQVTCIIFNNSEELKQEVLKYIIFLTSKLPNLKTLDFEKNKINNDKMKITSNEIENVK